MNSNSTDPVSGSQLRSFGLLFAALLLIIFAGLLPWIADRPIPQWPFWIAVPVATLALVWPRGLTPLYVGWMKFGEVMGRINTFLILGLLFYVVVTPIGWMMRLAGKDPMRRQLDHTAGSYRVASPPQEREHMEKPY